MVNGTQLCPKGQKIPAIPITRKLDANHLAKDSNSCLREELNSCLVARNVTATMADILGFQLILRVHSKLLIAYLISIIRTAPQAGRNINEAEGNFPTEKSKILTLKQ
jgi:hypothetical protein